MAKQDGVDGKSVFKGYLKFEVQFE